MLPCERVTYQLGTRRLCALLRTRVPPLAERLLCANAANAHVRRLVPEGRSRGGAPRRGSSAGLPQGTNGHACSSRLELRAERSDGRGSDFHPLPARSFRSVDCAFRARGLPFPCARGDSTDRSRPRTDERPALGPPARKAVRRSTPLPFIVVSPATVDPLSLPSWRRATSDRCSTETCNSLSLSFFPARAKMRKAGPRDESYAGGSKPSGTDRGSTNDAERRRSLGTMDAEEGQSRTGWARGQTRMMLRGVS